MGIADPDAALEVLEEFLSLIEAESRNRGQGSPTAWERLNELQPWVVRIARRVNPENVSELEAKSQSGSWRLGPAHTQTIRLIGLLKHEAGYRRMLDEGPTLAANRLHGWVWHAAINLWDGGHFKQAVNAAAAAVEEQAQLKLDRGDLSGADLYTQAFKVDKIGVKPDGPRLRFPHLDELTSDGKRNQDWTSAHQGAMNFGQGCALGIRNLNAHGTGELPEQEALEYLAALSVLARWVDACEPVPADSETTGGTHQGE